MYGNLKMICAGQPHDFTTYQVSALLDVNCKRSLSGPGCSKLTISLVNVSLKFQTLISNIRQYFLSKKCVKLLLLSLFQQKNLVYLVIKS